MDFTDCKLKTIFNNILQGFHIDELSRSIEPCSTIETTLSSVDQCKTDYQVFVVCRQPDVHLLEKHILNGCIDKIYILDDQTDNIRNNNRRLTASNERELRRLIILDASNYIRSVATDAVMGKVNGQVTAHLHTAYRLVNLARELNNQGH